MALFHGRDRLTRAQLREVIRRAELLDRTDLDPVSTDEVRAIAEEVGISEWALQRALAEIRTVDAQVPIWKRPAVVAVGTWVVGASAAGGLDVIKESMPQPFLAYTALGTLISLTCLSATLGFQARTSLARRRFQLGNLTMWTGFGFLTSIQGHSELAIPGFVIGVIAAGIGWLANRTSDTFNSSSNKASSSMTGEPAPESGETGWFTNLWSRLHRTAMIDNDLLAHTTAGSVRSRA